MVGVVSFPCTRQEIGSIVVYGCKKEPDFGWLLSHVFCAAAQLVASEHGIFPPLVVCDPPPNPPAVYVEQPLVVLSHCAGGAHVVQGVLSGGIFTVRFKMAGSIIEKTRAGESTSTKPRSDWTIYPFPESCFEIESRPIEIMMPPRTI